MVFDGARACHDNWVCFASNGDGSGSVSFSNQNASTFCLECTTHKLVGGFERDEASNCVLLLESGGGGGVNLLSIKGDNLATTHRGCGNRMLTAGNTAEKGH